MGNAIQGTKILASYFKRAFLEKVDVPTQAEATVIAEREVRLLTCLMDQTGCCFRGCVGRDATKCGENHSSGYTGAH